MNSNRNKIRLVAVDMDGTLLDSKKRIPDGFEEWVVGHPEVKVIAASGRQYYTLRDMFPLAADLLMYSAENGGLVFDQGENVFRDAMDRRDVADCIAAVSEMPSVTPILCAVQSAYMCHADENIESQGHMYYHHLTFLDNLYACPEFGQVIKVALYIGDHRAADTIHQIHLSDRVRPVVSGTDWIDVNNRTVNKGAGIRIIQKKYHISREESMAFGDYMNDYAMLRECAESYAMGNACAEIKRIAAHETDTNDENGVMNVLREF